MNAEPRTLPELQLAHEGATHLLTLAKQYEYPPSTIARQQARCRGLAEAMRAAMMEDVA